MKKILYSLMAVFIGVISIFQSTMAVIEETVSVAGTSFTVGTTTPGEGTGSGTNTALKFLINPSGTTDISNLTDTIQGPDFENIDALWTDQLAVKMHNKGNVNLNVVSKSEYINDPDTLRDDIYAQVIEWNDANNNGSVDSGEEGTVYGNNTILRWRNDTFPIGILAPGQTKGLILRFNGTGITDSNYGMTAVYDFKFTGIEQP